MIVEKDYNWFKRLGFYRKRMDYQGDCFVSIEESVMSRPYLSWNIDNVPKPRYIYNIRLKVIHDNLNDRYLSIDSIEELIDFIQGRNSEKQYRQLERNKGLYSQLNNGNIAPYTRGALDRTLLDEMLHYHQPERRQIRIQTGRAGMEEFRRSLEQDSNIWSQRELTEIPLLDMSEIGEPIRIGDATERPYQSDRVIGTLIALTNQNSELIEVQRQLNVIDEQARN